MEENTKKFKCVTRERAGISRTPQKAFRNAEKIVLYWKSAGIRRSPPQL